MSALGAEALGRDGGPIAPDPRAIAAGEAHDHVRVVAQAEGTARISDRT